MSSKRKNPPTKTISPLVVASSYNSDLDCDAGDVVVVDRKMMNFKSNLLLPENTPWDRLPPLNLEDLEPPNREAMSSSEYAERIIAQSRIILNSKKTMEDVLKQLSSQLSHNNNSNLSSK